ncbi:MAG: adenosylcobinamide-GDP ribazoletransferase [Dehalococcoidia bacterium]
MGFFTALKFLTIFPGPEPKKIKDSSFGESLPYFPVVGLVIGAILYGLYYGLTLILPLQIVIVLIILALVIMSGAHHLDGFIDTFDGITGSKPREKRLEIMADSHAGAIGVVAVILLMMGKYTALYSVTGPLPALLLMPVLSRWTSVFLLFTFPYARQTGMGLLFKKGARWYRLAIASVISLAAAILLLSWWGAVLMASLTLIVAAIAVFFNNRLGGLTGDCYGAIVEMSEVIVLVLLIIFTR